MFFCFETCDVNPTAHSWRNNNLRVQLYTYRIVFYNYNVCTCFVMFIIFVWSDGMFMTDPVTLQLGTRVFLTWRMLAPTLTGNGHQQSVDVSVLAPGHEPFLWRAEVTKHSPRLRRVDIARFCCGGVCSRISLNCLAVSSWNSLCSRASARLGSKRQYTFL